MRANLSEREWEILHAIYDGQSQQEVAYALHLHRSTVKNHLTNIYAKLILAGAIPDQPNGRQTMACTWVWKVEQAARGN